jgi:hypothetical protein
MAIELLVSLWSYGGGLGRSFSDPFVQRSLASANRVGLG